jgi:hypothetical protein
MAAWPAFIDVRKIVKDVQRRKLKEKDEYNENRRSLDEISPAL